MRPSREVPRQKHVQPRSPTDARSRRFDGQRCWDLPLTDGLGGLRESACGIRRGAVGCAIAKATFGLPSPPKAQPGGKQQAAEHESTASTSTLMRALHGRRRGGSSAGAGRGSASARR